jgi:hypothetical protein
MEIFRALIGVDSEGAAETRVPKKRFDQAEGVFPSRVAGSGVPGGRGQGRAILVRSVRSASGTPASVQGLGEDVFQSQISTVLSGRRPGKPPVRPGRRPSRAAPNQADRGSRPEGKRETCGRALLRRRCFLPAAGERSRPALIYFRVFGECLRPRFPRSARKIRKTQNRLDVGPHAGREFPGVPFVNAFRTLRPPPRPAAAALFLDTGGCLGVGRRPARPAPFFFPRRPFEEEGLVNTSRKASLQRAAAPVACGPRPPDLGTPRPFSSDGAILGEERAVPRPRLRGKPVNTAY